MHIVFKEMVRKESNLIAVPTLLHKDAVEIIDQWLLDNKRQLTTSQKNCLLTSVEKCPLPLYMKIIFNNTLTWTSFKPIEETHLQDTVRDSIEHLYTTLETRFGQMFVSRVLGYITAGSYEGFYFCAFEYLEI